jgi:hypothetical protein
MPNSPNAIFGASQDCATPLGETVEAPRRSASSKGRAREGVKDVEIHDTIAGYAVSGDPSSIPEARCRFITSERVSHDRLDSSSIRSVVRG